MPLLCSKWKRICYKNQCRLFEMTSITRFPLDKLLPLRNFVIILIHKPLFRDKWNIYLIKAYKSVVRVLRKIIKSKLIMAKWDKKRIKIYHFHLKIHFFSIWRFLTPELCLDVLGHRWWKFFSNLHVSWLFNACWRNIFHACLTFLHILWAETLTALCTTQFFACIIS